MATSPVATETPRFRARTNAPFPVIAITRDTFSFLFANIPQYLRTASPWALLFLVVWTLYQQVDPSQPPPDTKKLFRLWLTVEVAIVTLMAATPMAIAVAWHRQMLVGTAAPRTPGSAYGRYAVRTGLFVFLISFLPNNVYLGAAAHGVDPFTALLLYWMCILCSGFLVSRWSLSLPAVAAGAERSSMSASWAMTRGNALRLFGGCISLVVCTDIFYRVGYVVLGGIIGTLGLPEASAPAAAVLSVATWTLFVGLFATYLSLAYRFFAGRQDAELLREEFS
jgi:hypothetical protein